MHCKKEYQSGTAYTKKELARLLAVSVSMITKHTHPRGELCSFKNGQLVKYLETEVKRWIGTLREREDIKKTR